MKHEVTKKGNFVGQAGVNMFANNQLLTIFNLFTYKANMEDKNKALAQFAVILVVILVVTITVLKLALMNG